mgnify:CR=1 FL=1
MIILTAIEGAYDWLLFIDDDHTFAPDSFDKLVSNDKDFVVPLMTGRSWPYNLMAFTYEPLDKERAPHHMLANRIYEWGNKLMPIDTAGLGMALCRVDALAKLPRPYFDGKLDAPGEDTHFWNLVTSQGNQLWLDPTVAIGHLERFRRSVGVVDFADNIEANKMADESRIERERAYLERKLVEKK